MNKTDIIDKLVEKAAAAAFDRSSLGLVALERELVNYRHHLGCLNESKLRELAQREGVFL